LKRHVRKRPVLAQVADKPVRSDGLPVNAVKDLSPCVFRLPRSPFPPWTGKKVADRPDEGGFAGSDTFKSLRALFAGAIRAKNPRNSLSARLEKGGTGKSDGEDIKCCCRRLC